MKRYPVPVVRLIISDDTEKVLLLKRSDRDFAGGLWCLPGGKIDYGSTIEETVCSEALEELGVKITGFTFLFYQDSLPIEPGAMHCINFYFECIISGNIRLNEESSEYAWIGREELSRYAVTFRNDEALLAYWKQKE